MKRLSLNRKLITAGSLASIALTMYIVFGNHGWFEHRAPLEMDLTELHQTPTGEQVLERYPELTLRCAVQKTQLGQQACGARIASFNGIPAEHVAFYFDAEQNLTAWKLTVRAPEYPALRAHLAQRYGTPQSAAGQPVQVLRVGAGVLALEAETTHSSEPSVIWLFDRSTRQQPG